MTWWQGIVPVALVLVWLYGPGLLFGVAAGISPRRDPASQLASRILWWVGLAPGLSLGLIAGWAVVAPKLGIPFTPVSTLGAIGASAMVTAVAQRLQLVRSRIRWGRFQIPWVGLRQRSRGIQSPITQTLAHSSRGVAPSSLNDGTRVPHPWRYLAFGALGLVLSSISAALTFRSGLITIDRPPQTWDAVFHLNAIQFIADTGNGSSLFVGNLNQGAATVPGFTPTGTAFYPAAWHDLAALIAGVAPGASADLVVIANAIALVITAILWPLGLWLLVHQVFGPRPLLALFTPVLATVTVAFPIRLLSYGTLWPTALGYALIPVLLALCHRLIRGDSGEAGQGGRLEPEVGGSGAVVEPSALPGPGGVLGLGAVLGLGTLVGLGAVLAHPLAGISAAVLAIPIFLGWVWKLGRKGSTKARVFAGAVVAAGLAGVVIYAASPYATGQGAFIREPFGTWGPTLAGAFTDAHLSEQGFGNTAHSWLLAIATVAGAIAAIRMRKGRWLIISTGIAAALYTLSVIVTLPGYGLLAPWYFDPVRLGALIPIVQVPLAAWGVAALLEYIRHRLRYRNGFSSRHGFRHRQRERANPAVEPRTAQTAPTTRTAFTSLTVLLALIITFTTIGTRDDARAHQLDINYHITEVSGLNALLTREEHQLLHELSSLPDDSVILASPFTGGSLAYAVAEVPVVFAHLSGNWPQDLREVVAQDQLIERLGDGSGEVCGVVNKYGITHLYLDTALYWPDHPDQQRYLGLMGTPEEAMQAGLELVAGLDLVAGLNQATGTATGAALFALNNC